MRKLIPPTISFSELYDNCISNVVAKRKTLFQNAKQKIVDFTDDYNTQAKNQKLHVLQTDNGHPPLEKKDLIFLYKSKMVDSKQPGRNYYDKIMLTSVNQICPYCDCSPVESLDHVLAKKHYSRFAISPNNLVPSCDWCNGSKRDVILKSSSDIHFHPYFDSESDRRWLHARLKIDNDNILFEFYVEHIENWSEEENSRANSHFNTFKLNRKFSITAAAAVLDEVELVRLFKESPNSLKLHLQSVSNKLLKKKMNYWKTAMFCALSDSEWFCEGGVLNIDKNIQE